MRWPNPALRLPDWDATMSIHALLMSFGERPHLVLAVVFAAACTESFAVIGTFVPAGIVMFAAGALIGAGAVDGWLTIGVATLGAIAGDGLSYELGRRYHTQVGAWSRSHGHEAAWSRGEQFVARHGGKSIVFARFFAPVRAIVPLVVGTARMARATVAVTVLPHRRRFPCAVPAVVASHCRAIARRTNSGQAAVASP